MQFNFLSHDIKVARCSLLRVYFFLVALPTVIGASIYLLFRSTRILAFEWVEAAGFTDSMYMLRAHVAHLHVPSWILNSLPDGLWAFAFTNWMVIIWQGNPPPYWLFAGVTLGLCSEIGQHLLFVAGTYHFADIWAYVLGFGLACVNLKASK
jgi:hypothetical protein